ncbi:MAG: DUF1800 family protein, partial [Cupriavidus sp.]|nr:DUF1800 family protein [Cupriavidus sp.]
MALLTMAAALVACTSTLTNDAAPRGKVTSADLRWLNTVSFGADQSSVQRLQAIGRQRYFDEQLKMPLADPPQLAEAIAALPVSQGDALQRTQALRAEQARIQSLSDETEKQQAREALNRQGRDLVIDTGRRHLLRALYSPAQLREQMTWFWLNHFNVYSGKGQVRYALADFEARAIR